MSFPTLLRLNFLLTRSSNSGRPVRALPQSLLLVSALRSEPPSLLPPLLLCGIWGDPYRLELRSISVVARRVDLAAESAALCRRTHSDLENCRPRWSYSRHGHWCRTGFLRTLLRSAIFSDSSVHVGAESTAVVERFTRSHCVRIWVFSISACPSAQGRRGSFSVYRSWLFGLRDTRMHSS